MAHNCFNLIKLTKDSGFTKQDLETLGSSEAAAKVIERKLGRELQKSDIGARWFNWGAANDESSPSNTEIILFVESAWIPCDKLMPLLLESVKADKITNAYSEEGCQFFGSVTYEANASGVPSMTNRLESDYTSTSLDRTDIKVVEVEDPSMRKMATETLPENCFITGFENHDKVILLSRAIEFALNPEYHLDEMDDEEEATSIKRFSSYIMGKVSPHTRDVIRTPSQAGELADLMFEEVMPVIDEFKGDISELKQVWAGHEPWQKDDSESEEPVMGM